MDIFSLVGKITVNYGEAIKGIDEVSSKAGDMARSLGKTTQNVGQKITSVGKNMSSVGKSFAPVSVAVGGVATAAVKTAMDFDSAMSKVSAVSGATGGDFEALRNKAIEMGGKTKFSASEAAEAMNYMAMAGWKTGDMLSGIDGIMNLAAASGENLGITSDIVTDALTAFGLSAADSGHFADILASASSNANTNVSMLGESFKYVAPVAGAMGYSAEDVSIALGLMANAGIKASQSGTSLRTLMTNMASPTDNMAIAMDALGISLTDSEGNMYNFREMMDNLRSGFGSLHPEVELSEEQMADLDAQLVSLAEQYESGMISQEEYESSVSALTESIYGSAQAEQAKYAAMLAGKEGMSGLLAIVNASEEDYNKLASAIDNCDGAAKDMADTMQDNLAGDITTLGSQLETLTLSVVDLFTPALRKVVAHAQDFVKWLTRLDDSTKTMICTIAMVLAALSPVLITIGKVISAIGSITGAIGKVINLGRTVIGGIGKVITIVPKIVGAVSGVISFVTGTVIPGIAAVISAIGLIPIAIAGIITVIVLLWNKCDWFREGVIAIWEAIKSAAIAAWSAIKDFLISLWDEIVQIGKTVFEGLASFLSSCWQGIQTMFTVVLSAISTLFTTVWNGIKTVVTTVGTAIQLFLTTTWNAIKSIISTVLKAIQTTFTTVWNAIKTVITTAVNAIKSFITTAWNAIKSTITNVLNAIKSVVTSVWNGIKSVVTSIINSLKSFITSAFNAIKTVITNVSNSIKNVVSTVWNGIKSTISTILNGIKVVVSNVWNTIKTTVSTVTNVIKTVISTSWNAIKTVVTTVVGAIQNFITAAWNTIKLIVTTVMSTIQSVISNAWNGVKETISNVISGIQSTISGGLEGAKNIAANVLGAIKDKFSSIFDGATSIVKGAIDKIKSFFNFSWSLPKIKLPHFSISGKFSLNPPSIPKFGVQWYAKAMRDGMIMNQPTIFGYNAKSNQLLAGGEAGSETVVGTESLMNMIRSAVASENGELIFVLNQILEAITNLNDGLGKKFYEALLNMKFQINEREFARLVKAV